LAPWLPVSFRWMVAVDSRSSRKYGVEEALRVRSALTSSPCRAYDESSPPRTTVPDQGRGALVNVPQVVEQLLWSPVHGRCVTAYQHLPALAAEYGEWPAGLDGRLRAVLARRGIEQLYCHQAEAVGAALAGRSVCVVTPTASGKTLCYNL